jgi:hypothetical protein
MPLQITNDGACIRVQNGSTILHISKSQIKTVDTIRADTVRLDIGEGALKNICIRYSDVSDPVVQNAGELEDAIKTMLASSGNSATGATEQSQISILQEVQNLESIFKTQYYWYPNELDLTKREPSIIDESNPNVVYKGWHNKQGVTNVAEWAIQRITNINSVIRYEWAYGSQVQTNVWNDRLNYDYQPYDFERLPPPPPPIGGGGSD